MPVTLAVVIGPTLTVLDCNRPQEQVDRAELTTKVTGVEVAVFELSESKGQPIPLNMAAARLLPQFAFGCN